MVNLMSLAVMSYIGIVSLPTPVECRETFCEQWEETSAGLLCFDSDELYAPGHYHFEVSPEYDVNTGYPGNDGPWEKGSELQAFVEY